jgi:hypothetical protein
MFGRSLYVARWDAFRNSINKNHCLAGRFGAFFCCSRP